MHLAPAPVVARVATGTSAIRRGNASLSRELAVARYLADVGAPVVPPSAELAAGPHDREGLVLSFSEHVEEIDAPPEPMRAGQGLRHCHEALADFDGDLPRLGLLDDAEAIIERLADYKSLDDDAVLLRELALRVRSSLERLGLLKQTVHGDAHVGNVITTAAGPLWNDWEDTCQAPVAWDLGCLHASVSPFGHRTPSSSIASPEPTGTTSIRRSSRPPSPPGAFRRRCGACCWAWFARTLSWRSGT